MRTGKNMIPVKWARIGSKYSILSGSATYTVGCAYVSGYVMRIEQRWSWYAIYSGVLIPVLPYKCQIL
jgi:hypothetical protein